MGSLVCIVNRSRSLLRRGPTNSTLKISAHLFFAAHLSNTQKERGNILLQTEKLYRRDLAYCSFSFNPRTTHKRQTDRMKLALSTLVVWCWRQSWTHRRRRRSSGRSGAC